MEKILIVEDDNKIRKELEIFLNNNGYKVENLKTFGLYWIVYIGTCIIIDIFIAKRKVKEK